MSSKIILMIISIMLITGCSSMKKHDLPVVPYVNLEQYQGLWYEIARYPNRFQKKCDNSSATYTVRPDGKVEVFNECFSAGVSEPIADITGKAWAADKQSKAKLKVQFFWPFRADYWILALGDDYEYAVIGEPSRKYFWILSRTRPMNREQYDEILSQMPSWGYDPEQLIKDIY